ncbi:MAG: ribonuclease HII, partial [Eubacteriales bacterium]|nr:ribonuclease HII [Eubacteriales bacterium]
MKSDRTTPLWNFDLAQAAGRRIAGMDEAGRGPLAGPVVAACVCLPLDEPIMGVDDSKRLTAKKREALYGEITRRALAWGVGIVDEGVIDHINILNATKRAMEQAWQAMQTPAELLLIDAVKGLRIDTRLQPLIKGDATSYHVAAASILAKVTRDRLMTAYDAQYPAYGFAAHMGYGTARHLAALAEHGPCPIHRRTFLKNLKP